MLFSLDFTRMPNRKKTQDKKFRKQRHLITTYYEWWICCLFHGLKTGWILVLFLTHHIVLYVSINHIYLPRCKPCKFITEWVSRIRLVIVSIRDKYYKKETFFKGKNFFFEIAPNNNIFILYYIYNLKRLTSFLTY